MDKPTSKEEYWKLLGKEVVITSCLIRKRENYCNTTHKRYWEPVPYSEPIKGFIVGFRVIYDGVYTPSYSYYEQPKAKPSKSRNVVLVATGSHTKHIYVDYKDVTLVSNPQLEQFKTSTENVFKPFDFTKK